HALCFLSESFHLSFNHIARYALSRNTKIFSIKIHKSFAKQFIEIPLKILITFLFHIPIQSNIFAIELKIIIYE
ncbi:MAG: hypothetical protein II981_01580, partial [Bacteroidales bacterium]|nr:hypothetical protein [Bacteroidales bacterium]